MYDYASILFNGGCNANCPNCIGRIKEFKTLEGNLETLSLKGVDSFLDRMKQENIRYISVSGIFADPQQYKYETDLIKYVREKIPSAILSLHTNGILALTKKEEFNSYDKATISFPSFDSKIYRRLMGIEQISIERVVRESKIPVKLSMLLTKHNLGEVDDYILRTGELGIKRIILRKLAGKENELSVFEDKEPIKKIFGNPVYLINDVEVTVWNYSKSTARGLYLFPDGSLRDSFRAG